MAPFWMGLVAPACSGSDSQPNQAADASSASPDGASPDAALPLTEESEPNNGDSVTDLNELTLPVAVHGAIGEADDLDVFAVDLVAGELLLWTLEAQGGEHAPHLAIAEASNAAPPSVGFANPGSTLQMHHFALKSGRHHFIVRDERNVPAASSAHEGGPANQYQLRSSAPTINVSEVSIPQRLSATLGSRFDPVVMSFTLSQETDIKIEVTATRLAAPSDIDSRLSLFYVTGNDWLITNDDLAQGQSDSMVTGLLPAGEYRVVIDNINPSAANLDFEVDFALQ